MLKLTVSPLVIATFISKVAGHSWVMELAGTTKRGGLLTDDDSGNTSHFCPTASLADCQPTASTGVVLTAINQRPCVGKTAFSSPLGQATAGDDMLVSWAGNGHTLVPGACFNLYVAKAQADPAYSDFTQFANCVPYGPIPKGNVTVPADLATGDYTILWTWPFGSFTFSSCVDVHVTGQGSSSGGSPATTTRAPSTTMTPASSTAPSTTAKPVTSTAAPGSTSSAMTSSTPRHSDKPHSTTTTAAPSTTANLEYGPEARAIYREHGCASLPDDYCLWTVNDRSFCKTELKDHCGRALCESDSSESLSKNCASSPLI